MGPEKAKAILQRQRDEIARLRSLPRYSPEFKKWYRDTEIAIERIFGRSTRHVGDFGGVTFSKGWVARTPTPDLDAEAFLRGLASADAFLRSVEQEISDFGIADSTREDMATSVKETSSVQDPTQETLTRICTAFHRTVKQLRCRHGGRSTLDVVDEYDLQDLLHAVLLLQFEDVRPEEWAPSYAGASARADFLLPPQRAVIETKMTRNGLADRRIGEELIVDIAKYRGHPRAGLLFCFVYDPAGIIQNPRGLENDLSGPREGLNVRVLVAPK